MHDVIHSHVIHKEEEGRDQVSDGEVAAAIAVSERCLRH